MRRLSLKISGLTTHEESFRAFFILQPLASALLLDKRQTIVALTGLPNFAAANVELGAVVVLDHGAGRLAGAGRERLDLVAHHVFGLFTVLELLVEVKTVWAHVHPGALVHAREKLATIVRTLVLETVQLADAVLWRWKGS
jgi:hypothetical protein